MTRLARGAKCGKPGRPPASARGLGRRASSPSSEARAAPPSAGGRAATRSAAGVTSQRCSSARVHACSLLGDDFVEIQDQAGDRRVGGQLAGVAARRRRAIRRRAAVSRPPPAAARNWPSCRSKPASRIVQLALARRSRQWPGETPARSARPASRPRRASRAGPACGPPRQT